MHEILPEALRAATPTGADTRYPKSEKSASIKGIVYTLSSREPVRVAILLRTMEGMVPCGWFEPVTPIMVLNWIRSDASPRSAERQAIRTD